MAADLTDEGSIPGAPMLAIMPDACNADGSGLYRPFRDAGGFDLSGGADRRLERVGPPFHRVRDLI